MTKSVPRTDGGRGIGTEGGEVTKVNRVQFNAEAPVSLYFLDRLLHHRFVTSLLPAWRDDLQKRKRKRNDRAELSPPPLETRKRKERKAASISPSRRSPTSPKNAQALNNAQYIHVALSGSINLACTSCVRVCARVCVCTAVTHTARHTRAAARFHLYIYICIYVYSTAEIEICACRSREPCAPCRNTHTTFVHRHSRPYLHPAVIHTQRYPLLAALENPTVGSQTRFETVEKRKNNKRGGERESLFFFSFSSFKNRVPLPYIWPWIRREIVPIVSQSSFVVIHRRRICIYVLRKK